MNIGDTLYAITEWLRTTWLVDFALKLTDSSLSNWIVTHFWATGILQVVHMLAISTAFGAIVMINLRVFKLAGMERTMAETERRYVRWIWWSLAAVILSGIGLILSDTVRNLINSLFWIKMILVICAVVASMGFHGRVMRRLAAGQAIGTATRTASILIVLLWCLIMVCGRWIAYAPN